MICDCLEMTPEMKHEITHVCVCVCVCVYIHYIHTYTNLYTYICTRKHEYIYIYIHIYIYIYAHTPVHVCYTQINTDKCMYMTSTTTDENMTGVSILIVSMPLGIYAP
jgi:hypothetical protein